MIQVYPIMRGMPVYHGNGIPRYTSVIRWFELMTCYDPLAKMECTPKIPKIPKYLLKGTPAHSNVGGSWKTDEA